MKTCFRLSLQTTARIIEDHKPLVEDLNVTGAELQVTAGPVEGQGNGVILAKE